MMHHTPRHTIQVGKAIFQELVPRNLPYRRVFQIILGHDHGDLLDILVEQDNRTLVDALFLMLHNSYNNPCVPATEFALDCSVPVR